jgi:tetratricopeptide (TPR) repeat protein
MPNNSNKNNLTFIVVAVLALLTIAYSLNNKKKSSDLLPNLATMNEPLAPHFDWLDNIDAPVINNRQELSKVWQSKPRCCVSKRELTQNNREFYKACYVAMQTYPSDEDINAKCLWLMGSALETSEQRLQLYETYMKHYFYYDKKLDHCANCAPANISARIAQSLAGKYIYTDRFDDAIKLLERMNDERSQETSDWVLAELSTQLGKYYLMPEYIGNNINRIKMNYSKLKPTRGSEQLGKRFGKPGRFDKLETVYNKLIKKQKG